MIGAPCRICTAPVTKPGTRCNACCYVADGGAARARRYRQMRQGQWAGRPRPTRCDVCGGPSGGRGTFHFDHDHNSGAFRGWLCASCNQALGQAGDNPRILRALADYLDRTCKSPTRPLIS